MQAPLGTSWMRDSSVGIVCWAPKCLSELGNFSGELQDSFHAKKEQLVSAAHRTCYVLAMNKLNPIARASSARKPRSGTAATTSAASFID